MNEQEKQGNLQYTVSKSIVPEKSTIFNFFGFFNMKVHKDDSS